jgi:TRAP-type C4-dicarboxylate transport system substrate-binding protein
VQQAVLEAAREATPRQRALAAGEDEAVPAQLDPSENEVTVSHRTRRGPARSGERPQSAYSPER